MERQEEIKQDIIKEMKRLDTYDSAYTLTINTLARTQADLERAIHDFEKTGGLMVIKHTNKAGATNFLRNPYYISIEKLRSDVVAYCKELGLTPGGRAKVSSQIKDGDELLEWITKT